MQNNNTTLPLIAIIGASYAGLTLANILHMHNIPYVIFDSKSLPFTYVMGGGGTTFNVPSYKKLIVKKLELDTTNTSTHCNTEEEEEKGWLTRQDVIESLLQRVQSKLITCTRIVHIEHKSSEGFYLHSSPSSSSSSSQQQRQSQQQQHHSCEIHGPYKYIIGADGVLSQVRTKAFHSTYLIGDARWAQDRYYDLGYQRIKMGANIALLDGLELGQMLVYDMMEKRRGSTTTNEKDDGQEGQQESIMTHDVNMAALKFCAWEISRRRTKRRRCIFFIIVVVIIMIYNLHSE